MGAATEIGWTDSTWNPWQGCTVVSEGCVFCYMYRDKTMHKQDPTTVVRSADATFYKPLHWKHGRKVFTSSWSDFFHEDADPWRAEAWEIIRKTPQHTYQILTKRPERVLECLPADWGSGYPNVWLGCTIENQKRANQRLAIMAQWKAVVRFVSFEPLLGPIYLVEAPGVQCFPNDVFGYGLKVPFEWAIIGGESGNENGKWRYRPCELDWIRTLMSDLRAADVPIFLKQLGTYQYHQLKLKDRSGSVITEWPLHLQIQEFPTIKSKSREHF